MSEAKLESIRPDQARADGSDGHNPLPLLTTKLYRPPVTPDLIRRERLLERLDRNRQRPLTLISAPAGYGKSVLARTWLQFCDWPSGWVSLDRSDNDIHTFFSYLLAAIAGIFPDTKLKTRAMRDAPDLPAAPVLARYLLNDLAEIETPFILALDDVHRIQALEIFNLLEALLQNPHPNLHMLLISRQDPPLPIISLRARSQVTEIRTFELRFTPQETAHLMRKMLDREVDPSVAADWARRTDGWVTALRLAVLSLRHRDKEDDLGLRIRGDSRYLRDYLLAEVLTRLPKHYQSCLIKIAFLERFCAPLCETIYQTDTELETASLNGETFIDWLECENLFLIPLDDQHKWFRFHHLFRELLLDMLKAQLNAEEISALRMRASRWYAKNNLVDEALQYALAAGNVESAVLLVEQNRYELMNSGQWRRLERWLGLFPASIVAQTPILLITRAFLGIYFGQDKHVLYIVNERKHLLRMLLPGTAEYQFLQAEIDAVQALVDMIHGRPTSTIACARRSLKRLPSQALYARSIANSTMAICLQMEGKLRKSVALIRGVLGERTWPAGLHTQQELFLCIAYYQQGDLNGVLRTVSEYMQLVEQYNLGELLSYGWYFHGIAHYLRNEFVQAESYLLSLVEDRALSAPSYLANGIFALALLYHAMGRESEANQVIDLLTTHLHEAKDTFGWVILEAIQVELALRQNNLEQARQLSTGVNFDIRPPYWLFYIPQLTEIKLLLAEDGLQNITEACTRLEVLAAEMAKINRNNARIDALALLALARATQGDQPAAFSHIYEALRLGYRGRFIRTFVDLGQPMADLLADFQAENPDFPQGSYLDQIMAAFPENQHAQGFTADQSKLVEPLTDRELEVLALLAQRLSNKEIAAKLVISPRTVKRHTINIYQKLGVNSRLQAVDKASELGILV